MINASLGKGMDSDQMIFFNSQSFCPELCGDERILKLFSNTKALKLIESVIGTAKIANPSRAQIALRFPINTNQPKTLVPHLDGFYSPTNGLEKAEINTFTALVGFF